MKLKIAVILMIVSCIISATLSILNIISIHNKNLTIAQQANLITQRDSIIRANQNYIDSLNANYYIVNKKDFKLIKTLNLKTNGN